MHRKEGIPESGKESGLSYSELQTTLQIAAKLANERPIDARVQSCEDSVQYITPNTLYWDEHLQVVTLKHLTHKLPLQETPGNSVPGQQVLEVLEPARRSPTRCEKQMAYLTKERFF